jgi:dihydroorotate dehydrogenase/NAD-dependent dihydropyrimidine dehydrogenase PreA subunit
MNAELWSEMDYRPFIHEELPQVKKQGVPIVISVGYSPDDLKILAKELATANVADAVEFSIHYVDKDVSNLQRLANSLTENCDLPVIAKLSPSIGDIEAVIKALDGIVDGYAAINSVGPALDFDVETLRPSLGSEDGRGWLSGHAILPLGLHFVAAMSQMTDKPIIGVGGIRSVIDVVKYIMAGASAVQICSLAILKGQNVYCMLAEQLSDWMDAHDYSDIECLIGAFHKRPMQQQYILGEGTQLHSGWKEDRCNFCNRCVKLCVHEAIQFENQIFQLDRSKCVSCGLCTSICPRRALNMEEWE